VTGGLVCALLFAAPASAENLFEQLFGGITRVFSSPGPAARGPMDSLASAPDAIVTPRPDSGPSQAFCVRTCDGHFFPVQAHRGITAAAACQSMCPAAETRLYAGSNIDYATTRDGSRYADLPSAFLYRKKLIAGCTCNGRTPFGLVNLPAADDPTLRPGDVVATKDGIMAVTGSGQLTPAAGYAGLPASERARFSQMKVTPQYGVAPAAPIAAIPRDEKSAALKR
jgi:hypothetical protein